MSQRTIARELKTSRCFIQNVFADYDHTGSSLQHPRDPPERRIMNAEVISCIETEKLMKPSVYVRELQDRLLLDGVIFWTCRRSLPYQRVSGRISTWQKRKYSKYHQNHKGVTISIVEMNSLKQYPTWNQAPFAVLTRVVLWKQLVTENKEMPPEVSLHSKSNGTLQVLHTLLICCILHSA